MKRLFSCCKCNRNSNNNNVTLPDLSHPKWERREKLSRMNFVNKGKDNSPRNHLQQNRILTDKSEKLPYQKQYGKHERADVLVAVKNSLIPPHRTGDNVIKRPDISTDKHHPVISRQKIEMDFVKNVASNSKSDLSSLLAQQMLQDPDYFRDVSSYEYKSVINANSKLGRYQEAQKAFDLMLADGIKPDIKSYNSLINSYANARRLQDVVRIFQSVKSYGLSPNTFSYSIVIKTLTSSKRLTDAFHLYSDMKRLGVPVSQSIYTILINGCSKIEDYDRAWKLFEHLQFSQHKPDDITMNSMIHICAKTANVERAFKMFDLMKTYHIQPTDVTFNSVIHACSKRPDYYQQTFEMVAQMREAGYEPDSRTYKYMLDACAIQGDIKRAKALFAEMTECTVDNLGSFIRCYARIPLFLIKLHNAIIHEQKMDEFKRKEFLGRIGTDNEKRVTEKGLKPIDMTEWVLDDKYDPDEQISLKESFGKSYQDIRQYSLVNDSIEETFDFYKEEALSLIKTLVNDSKILDGESTDNLPAIIKNAPNIELNSYLINTLIHTLGAYGSRGTLIEIFDSAYLKYNAKKDAYSYFTAIDGLLGNLFPSSNRQLDGEIFFLNKAMSYLEEYENYRATKEMPENWTALDTKYVRSKLLEKGVTDAIRKNEYRIYRTIIRGLVEYDELYKAAALLSVVIRRGFARITLPEDTYNPLKSQIEDEKVPQYFKSEPLFNRNDFDRLLQKTQIHGLEKLELEVQELLDEASKQTCKSIETRLVRQAINEAP